MKLPYVTAAVVCAQSSAAIPRQIASAPIFRTTVLICILKITVAFDCTFPLQQSKYKRPEDAESRLRIPSVPFNQLPQNRLCVQHNPASDPCWRLAVRNAIRFRQFGSVPNFGKFRTKFQRGFGSRRKEWSLFSQNVGKLREIEYQWRTTFKIARRL